MVFRETEFPFNTISDSGADIFLQLCPISAYYDSQEPAYLHQSPIVQAKGPFLLDNGVDRYNMETEELVVVPTYASEPEVVEEVVEPPKISFDPPETNVSDPARRYLAENIPLQVAVAPLIVTSDRPTRITK